MPELNQFLEKNFGFRNFYATKPIKKAGDTGKALI
jgi:hypothetical protein